MEAKKKKKSWTREIGEVVLAFAAAWISYQLLSMAVGTSLPIVAVVSDSMYHTNTYDGWWLSRAGFYEEMGITKNTFEAFPFKNGLSRGDLLLVVGGEPHVGDVVIYDRAGHGFTIVHRLVNIESDSYVTKGDNNLVPDPAISKSQLKGKVVAAVPLLGYPRFLLFAFGI